MTAVRWKRAALDELADLWNRAESALRGEITQAANEIDHRLKADPRQEGESRPRGRRILFVLPLGISFRVSADGNTVWVLHVWQARRR